MNVTRIHHVLERKRAEHPELRRRRIGMRELRAAARREGIHLRSAQIPAIGGMAIMKFMGGSEIILDSSLPAWLRPEVLAHELAHVWLHHGRRRRRSVSSAQETWWTPPSPGSQERLLRRELEADYLAGLLCAGLPSPAVRR